MSPKKKRRPLRHRPPLNHSTIGVEFEKPAGSDPGVLELLWSDSRAGARAGRGYHYQDLVGAWVACRVLAGEWLVDRLVPEGWEDLACEGGFGLFLQAKSRQERVGDFSRNEVAGFVLDLAERQSERESAGLLGRPVLVLERPIAGVILSAWDQPLAEVLPTNDPVVEAVRFIGTQRGLGGDHIEAALGTVAVFVLPWGVAASQASALVGTRYGLPPSAAVPVVLALRNEVANRADANAAAGWASRVSIDRTAIELIATNVVSLIDRSSLQEALLRGICEPVDFDQPLNTPGFFEGVEVQPGHIAAGLPAPRPDVTGQVVAAIDAGEVVLLTGPSGVGKSTVMWAAAYSARHILWYRIRKLYEEDVDAVIRLTRAMMPSERSPVGFIVDGVGVGRAQAWDALQREVVGLPGVALLGTARTEDLLPLRTLSNCTTVAIALDETVAEQIYLGLVAADATQLPHWREAYESAHGLTMEFTHMLTRGRRLIDVLTEQVMRRVAEHREMELRIIAIASVAHQWGADLALQDVRAGVGGGDAEFRDALARLQNEHLVQVEKERISGLHQLRSKSLAAAVHRVPPPTLTDTIRTVLGLLDDHQMPPFVLGLLTEQPELDTVALGLIVAELQDRADTTALIGVLQALRIVDFQRLAAPWAAVLDRHDVKPANHLITLELALLGSDLPAEMMKPEIVAAVDEISPAVNEPFRLRDRFLDLLGISRIAAALVGCSSKANALGLMAVLSGTGLDLSAGMRAGSTSAFASLVAQADAQSLGEVLATARNVSQPFADRLFDLAGGEEAVWSRLQAFLPWLIKNALIEDDGRTVAFARLMHVSDEDQRNPDDAVREFGRILLRCFPRCDSVDVQALLPGDVPIQIGDDVFGMTKLQRRYDRPPIEVAWNVLRSRLALVAVGTITSTVRAHLAKGLVHDLDRYLTLLVRTWCISRGRPDEAEAIEAERRSLLARAADLRLPLDKADITYSESDPDVGIPNDHLHTMVEGIAGNLTSRMNSENADWSRLAAFAGDTLRRSVQETRSEERWDLIGSEAPQDLDHIGEMLDDLHAIFAELAWGDLKPSAVVQTARSGPSDQALTRVARAARLHAKRRVSSMTAAFTSAAEGSGIAVRVYTRDIADTDAVVWPAAQIAIAVDLERVAEWENAQTIVKELMAYEPSEAGMRAPVLITPFFRGHPVRLLARKLITDLWPDTDLFDTWADQLPAAHPTPLAEAVIYAHGALQILSGLAVLSTLRDTTPEHQRLAERAANRFLQAFQTIAELAPDNAVVAEISSFLGATAERVQDELEAGPPDGDARRTLAAGIALGATGTAADDFAGLDGLVAISLQWDLDPDAAAELLGS